MLAKTNMKSRLFDKKTKWRLRLKKILLVLGLFFLITPLTGLAQSNQNFPAPTAGENGDSAPIPAYVPTTGASNQIPKATVIATVDIHNAKIESQKGHQLEISFQLSNREKIQPDVQYSVFLTKKDKSGNQITASQKVYAEIVNLGENQAINKTIKYVAPPYLDGEYTAWVRAANEVGMPYAAGYLGKVKFQKEKDFIEIKPGSYLTVGKDKTSYSLFHGVDVKPEEDLFIHCVLKNHFKEEKTIVPKFTTYLRSIFGKVVDIKNISSKISLKPNEEKEIILLVPKAIKPQAYDAILSFTEKDNKNISFPLSNPVTFHYVMVGESATIQNVRLDKPNYKKGEKATISFRWSDRADQFIGARYFTNENEKAESLKTNIAILSQNNKSCANVFSSTLGIKHRSLMFEIPIIKNCIGAKADVKIINAKGKILAQRVFQSPKTNKQSVIVPKTNKQSVIAFILVLILILIVAFILAYFYIKKRKNTNNSDNTKKFFTFLIILLGLSLFGNNADATTFSVCTTNGAAHCYTFYVSLDKSQYNPGENIRATLNAIAWTEKCGNYGESVDLSAQNNGRGIKKTIFHYNGSISHSAGSVSGYLFQTFTAPNLAGSYFMKFIGTAWPGDTHYKNTRYANIPYNVRPTCSINWSPLRITAPGSSTISWRTNAPRARYNCTGPIAGSHSVVTSGRVVVSFTRSQTRRETCTLYPQNSRGNNIGSPCSASVTVSRPTYHCTSRIPYHASAWSSSENTGLSSRASWHYHSWNSGSKCEYRCNSGYTWNSYNSCSIRPTVSLTASPNSVAYNHASTLRWTTTYASSCYAYGSWSGWKSNRGGSVSTGNLTSTKTYSIECWNSAGVGSGRKSVTVRVGARPTYHCTSRIPSNASVWSSSENTGLTSSASWHYHSWNSGSKCEYRCNSGYTWNGSSCTRPTSSGSLTCGSSTQSSIKLNYSFSNASYVYLFRGNTRIKYLGHGSGNSSYTNTGLSSNHPYSYYLRNGSSSSSSLLKSTTCRTSTPAPTRVSGSCGTASRTYSPNATSFGSYTLCASGNLSPSSVSFPSQGSTVWWHCNGSGGGSTAYGCNAIHQAPAPINASCGPNNQPYAYNVTAWPSILDSAFCSKGTLSGSTPSFPVQGAHISWTCLGQNGGSNITCNASRGNAPAPAPVCTCENPSGHCKGSTYDDSCGNKDVCTDGTKDCFWKEVAPYGNAIIKTTEPKTHYVIRLNSATVGKSCNNICAEHGETCVSAGDNETADNSVKWEWCCGHCVHSGDNHFGSKTINSGHASCPTTFPTPSWSNYFQTTQFAHVTCHGHTTSWTYCKCKK